MFSPFLKRIVVDIALFAAFIIGLFYCKEDFLDFLISLFHFGSTVNLSSLAYVVERAVYILIPLIMLTAKTKMPKYKILKIMFYTIAVTYILGNTWIIYYLVSNSFSGEAFSNLWFGSTPIWFAGDKAMAARSALYEFQYNNAFVFNYIMWDSYNLFGVLFSFIMGWLYFRFGYKINGHMKRVCNRYLIVSLAVLVIPILYNILIEKSFMVSALWREKNTLLIFSSVLVYISLRISSESRTFWNDLFA